MQPGGFDALMAQLDAGTKPQSEVAANLINTPGALQQIVQAGSPVGSLGGLEDWVAENAGNLLSGENDYRKGRIAERQAAGVEPSDGPIDWNAIMYDLNAPKRERGVEFEGPIDWNGIGGAINGAFGGIGEAFSAPAPRVVTPMRDIPTNNGGLVERTKPQGVVDPQTGFVLDPGTNTWYRPDFTPMPERLTAAPAAPKPSGIEPATPSFDFSSFDIAGPLQGLAAGIDAEKRRLAAGENPAANVDLPRPRPQRPGEEPAVRPAMAVDPWTEEVMPPSNVNPAPAEPKEPTVWDRAVDMAGGAMGNTLLGGAVKTLFPDFWNGAGDMMKGNGTMGTLGPDPFADFDTSQSSGGGAIMPADFIDLNHNGIDDRTEGYVPPAAHPAASAPQINYGSAMFPNMPPYNPGVSNEWQYFRPQGYAEGGLVQYAEGGEVAAAVSQSPNGAPMGGLDPRITIIADAEDALTGESANPDEALALFVKSFGPDALAMLKAQVQSGMTLRGHQRKKPRMAKGRFIEGAGGPTDDAIPAVIDGGQPAALSDGEFVVPAAAVRGAGEGDKNKGAAKLEQLSAMLAGSEQ